ncbi:PD-(D/E)XK nuclease family protein [Chamaesiphon sp. VAR_48_metabat_135_sub]|uniref:PD-(D/E)XK nuclease family protein n=1 Tax=Chamaesiphon sp. VAR_48_metabat_135_sub TaxID=2964699 RepID=UPI00286BAE3D|nr:PD-(D/E)XK nuclease family protein [Chamaesiphon sp. VAR_48_metabat_135_sub]
MNFASYHLWSQFEPALGREDAHCQMQRGWRWTQKSSVKEVPELPLAETIWQKVGKLAQQGIYEFHQDPLLLKHPKGSERVADRLYLYYEIATVRARVMRILQQYQAAPFLLGQDILVLNRGDEPIPPPIDIQVADDRFQLFAAFDCIIRSSEDRIHIIDFKTGIADFDRRQADVYLLACSYLYPDLNAVASFHNLETMTRSELITTADDRLDSIASTLARIAKLHRQQLEEYQLNPDCFDRLFPAHPGRHCQYCPFNYRCAYAAAGLTN